MTADLAYFDPSGFLEGFDGVLAGYVSQLAHGA